MEPNAEVPWFMKAYLITTGTLFGVLALVHIWRVISTEPQLATDPWYVLVTVIAVLMSFWAFALLRLATRHVQASNGGAP
jgi:hypothetical protein